MNLWNPSAAGMSVWAVLLCALLLGMVHGITPDEHTWPITFSYAVGSYSWKGGMRAGLLFSLSFTVQRMIACELAFLLLKQFTNFVNHPMWNFAMYIVVGSVMFGSGLYILNRGRIPHLLHTHGISGMPEAQQSAPLYMPLIHGFIAGWGTGAFALITYTVLAPKMGSVYVAFMPGLFFGLGTLVMQMILGALFGAWMARRKVSVAARELLAKLMSGRTLKWAGLGFVIVGTIGVIFPEKLDSLGVSTHLKVHNLHTLNAGFFLAVVVLFGVAIYSFVRSIKDINRFELARTNAAACGESGVSEQSPDEAQQADHDHGHGHDHHHHGHRHFTKTA